MKQKLDRYTQRKDMTKRIPFYYYVGQLEAETTADIPNRHRFRVNGVLYHQYSKCPSLMLAYIAQSGKSERWKSAATRYIYKRYNLDDTNMRLLALFDLI